VLGGQQVDDAQLRGRQVLEVVDQDVAPAPADPRTHVRPLLQQLADAQHQLAEVQQPLLQQQAVVGLEQPRELALALGPVAGVLGRQPRGPLAEPRRPQAGVLEPVDPRDHRAQDGRRPPAQVVVAQRQLVDAVQQQREAVGRRRGHREGVDARLQRLVAQQPRAHAVDRQDRELLERPVAERVLDPSAQGLRGGGPAGEQQDLLRRDAVGHQRGETRDQRLRPAAARAAEDQQRTAAVGRDRCLRRRRSACDGAGRSGHDPRIWP
jgi:hypothetical protein